MKNAMQYAQPAIPMLVADGKDLDAFYEHTYQPVIGQPCVGAWVKDDKGKLYTIRSIDGKCMTMKKVGRTFMNLERPLYFEEPESEADFIPLFESQLFYSGEFKWLPIWYKHADGCTSLCQVLHPIFHLGEHVVCYREPRAAHGLEGYVIGDPVGCKPSTSVKGGKYIKPCYPWDFGQVDRVSKSVFKKYFGIADIKASTEKAYYWACKVWTDAMIYKDLNMSVQAVEEGDKVRVTCDNMEVVEGFRSYYPTVI